MATLKNILIIDDDRVHLFTTQKLILLSKKGVQIKSCRDAKQAIKFLGENINNVKEFPDIILLDIIMPEWNGWQFLLEYGRLLSSFPKSVKLYILTTSLNPTDIQRANSHPNVDGYFNKPLTIEKLDMILDRNMI